MSQHKTFGNKRHVYVIDDDRSLCRVIARGLEHSGYEVHQFADAVQFLKTAIQFTPAVLVLDMKMPKMSGLELQAQLKQDGWKIPVIFMSGESSVSQGIMAMKQGAIDFLEKPFDLDRLLTLVAGAIRQSSHDADAADLRAQCVKKLEQLTPREIDTFFLLAKGHTYQEMMDILKISMPTAKQYRAAVMRKLGFSTLSQLIRFYEQLMPAQTLHKSADAELRP